MSVKETVSAVLIRHVDGYPPPPTAGFEVSPDVDTMWRRYLGYRDGREPLLAMAYFVFTMVTAAHGRRSQAASRYNIDEIPALPPQSRNHQCPPSQFDRSFFLA